ncbi:MAG: hypothetical protein KAQ94_09470 [Arcobacteraceae bacterium]|nr:hypothetical protein [Arcobacteraceae bacterium]
MNHSDFVRKYNSKEITVNIDINKAGYMYEHPLMPKKFRTKQVLLRALGFGGLIVSLSLFFLIQWWIAIIILIISFSIFPIIQKSAGNDVLEASLENSVMYDVAIENQTIVINNEKERISTIKMTKEEIDDIQTKGLKLIEDIEEEVKYQKIGYKTKSKTFKGNYAHYRKFFQQLKDFKDFDNDGYMFTINTTETKIGVTIVHIKSRNIMDISAEKLY